MTSKCYACDVELAIDDGYQFINSEDEYDLKDVCIDCAYPLFKKGNDIRCRRFQHPPRICINGHSKFLQLYCKHCKSFLCKSCDVESMHSLEQCQVVPIEEAASEAAGVIYNIHDEGEEILKTIAKVLDSVEVLQDKNRKTFESRVAYIDSRTQILHNLVRSTYTAKDIQELALPPSCDACGKKRTSDARMKRLIKMLDEKV